MRNNRLGGSALLTENLFKRLVATAVRKLQLSHGLTDQDLSDLTASSASTIENARNENNKLSGHTLLNLLAVDAFALEGLLHHFGRRSVPIEAKCDTDELVSTAGAVHRLASVKSPDSPGGAAVTDNECLDIEPEIDAALHALSALKCRCEEIRKARAA